MPKRNGYQKISLLLFFLIYGCTTLPESAQPPSPAVAISPTPALATAQPSLNPDSTEATPLPTPQPPPPTIAVGNLRTPTPEAFPSPTPAGGAKNLMTDLVTPQKTTPTQVDLVTADDVRLVGTYYPPTQDDAPAILLLHMLDSDRQAWKTFAQLAQGEGYAALTIDLRGHGESGGARDFTQMDLDIDTALAWLMSREEVDPDRTAIIGASIGANLALRGGANHPQVKAVALLSPGLDYSGITTTDAATTYGQRPWLIIAAAGDGYAADSAHRLQDLLAETGQLQIYEGNAHGTNLFNVPVGLTPALFEWLAQAL